jgi:hypothetical protein
MRILLTRLSLLPLLFAGVVWSQPPAANPSFAQVKAEAAESETDLLVDRLVENAARSRATLPSLSAHASIVSKIHEVVVFGKNTGKAEATVHMVRRSPDQPLKEIRDITEYNGKKVSPDRHVVLPFDMVDSFSDIRSTFFSSEHRPCYTFTLAAHTDPNAPLELTVTASSDAATVPECATTATGRTGFVRVDPATTQVMHLESSRLVTSGATSSNLALSVDYAPANVGDKTLWLPTVETARVVLGKTPMEWACHYTDYHLFAATVKVLPIR